MAASDLTQVAYIYKKQYSDHAVADLATRDHPLFAMISKQGGFIGKDWTYAIRYGNPQGVAGTLVAAQAGATGSKGVQLSALRRPKYGVITLNGEALAAAEGNKGAFLDLVTQETDGILGEMGDAFAFDLYRSGGSRGKRLSAAANAITMTIADDARNFKVGMTVLASPNLDGSTPRAGTTTVAAVDEDGGIVTLVNAAAITAFANADFLFRNGDPGTCMEGLEALTPLIAPVNAESFRGIDRSVDSRRLSGSRINDLSSAIEENLGLAAVRVSQVGSKCDRGVLNPIRFWEVARRLNAKVEYSSAGGAVEYGFESISISTPAGTLKVLSDPDCPTNRGRIFKLSTMYLKTLKGLPHIIQDDGRVSLRATAADDIEIRARGFVNLVQDDPSSHGVVAI